MLAKVVAHAPTRAEAVRALATALAGARIHGLTTNRDLLVRSLRHPEFAAGQLDTGFYDRHLDTLTGDTPDPTPAALAAALAEASPGPDAPSPPASAAGATSAPGRRPAATPRPAPRSRSSTTP